MPQPLLYLFSSNIRPLYVQDILDVLAAPYGARYQFRYEEKYVSDTARTTGLAGMPVLVHFSIQQEARYHDPAFVPVRRGKVVNAEARAGIFVVEFELGDYVALVRKPSDAPSVAVAAYTAAVKAAGIEAPYDVSASVGPDLAADTGSPFDTTSGETIAFRSTTELLQRTDWFRDARFVRFLRMAEHKLGANDIRLKDGYFNLKAGTTYELELTHYEPADVTTREPFIIDADGDVLRIVGRAGFDIASRYDVIPLYVHAVRGSGNEPRATVVAIRPGVGVQGPSLRIPVRVLTSKRRTVSLALATAAVLVLFGLPAVFTSMSQGAKFALVLAGAFGASALQAFGWSVQAPSGFGFTGRASRAAVESESAPHAELPV